MRTRARADGDERVLNGAKCWITNSGKSTWYTVMAVTDPGKSANGISAFIVHKDDPGFIVGPTEPKLGIKGSPTTELYFEDCRIPGDRLVGEPGTGFKTALASLDPTRPTTMEVTTNAVRGPCSREDIRTEREGRQQQCHVENQHVRTKSRYRSTCC